LKLLSDIDAAYIEFSPSGNGLRAFGFAKNLDKGVIGQLDGLSVELYSDKRYLTVTGRAIKNEPFREFVGFHDLAKKIRLAFPQFSRHSS
jgi:primase-polymerase (primpol)-like protein